MRPSRPRRRRQPVRLLLLAVLLLAATVSLVAFMTRGSSPYQAIGNRSEFTSNACIAYNPTAHDRHRTVFIDPGHGGPDPGASGVAPDGHILYEKALTLPIALDMLPTLRADGYRVVLSRTADTSVAAPQPGYLAGGVYTIAGTHAETAVRAACANAAGAQLLLSMHFDAFDDPSVGGVETLYDPSRPFSAANLKFATLVQRSVLSTLASHGWSVPDRGVQSDTAAGTPALTSQGAAYGHLMLLGPAKPGWFDAPSRMPGALCEPLFLTDPGEATLVESHAGQQALATAFVEAINRYFGAH